jgi:putative DNA primase/helicase
MIRANEIHARLGNSWPAILVQLGVPENMLRNKHGPCPACGGKDRFRFDNKRGRGDFICNQCGAGDGFKLLERTFGWTFSMARGKVIAAAGLASGYEFDRSPLPAPTSAKFESSAGQRAAQLPARVHRLRSGMCSIENCDDAVDYLESRRLWPLPERCSLRAHATVEYWDRDSNRRIGRYPALVADVLDIAGELVTCHVTWLSGGKKLSGYKPRKILTDLVGRIGCAARLMPVAHVLGIAEGIETALSAALIDGIPVWAALNTSLLARFEPPATVRTLRVYADRDEAGLMAALKLLERLQGRIRVEIRTPPAPAKDWNDTLLTRNGRSSGQGEPNE